MSLRLFEHPLSPYARRLKILLYEKGIPFDRVFVDPNQQDSDLVFQEFVMASPRREVPCLVHDGLRLHDSQVIAEYLEERFPKPEMMPDTPSERARVRMLESMLGTSLEAVLWGLGEIQFFRRAEGALADALIERAREQLARFWGRLERDLGQHAWLSGKHFGRADAAAYPLVSSATLFALPVDSRFTGLLAWSERCAARESVQKDAAELGEFFSRIAAEGDSPPAIVRQYRDHRLEWMLRSGGLQVVLDGLENQSIRFAQEFE